MLTAYFWLQLELCPHLLAVRFSAVPSLFTDLALYLSIYRTRRQLTFFGPCRLGSGVVPRPKVLRSLSGGCRADSVGSMTSLRTGNDALRRENREMILPFSLAREKKKVRLQLFCLVSLCNATIFSSCQPYGLGDIAVVLCNYCAIPSPPPSRRLQGRKPQQSMLLLVLLVVSCNSVHVPSGVVGGVGKSLLVIVRMVSFSELVLYCLLLYVSLDFDDACPGILCFLGHINSLLELLLIAFSRRALHLIRRRSG